MTAVSHTTPFGGDPSVNFQVPPTPITVHLIAEVCHEVVVAADQVG